MFSQIYLIDFPKEALEHNLTKLIKIISITISNKYL